MSLVSPGCSILVVVSEDDTAAIEVTVVERVAVSTRELLVVGLDDLPIDDIGVVAVLFVLNDPMRHLCPMVLSPSQYSYGQKPIVISGRDMCVLTEIYSTSADRRCRGECGSSIFP